MTPYILFFFIIAFLLCFLSFGDKNLRFVVVLLGAVLGILFSGFRDNVGVDDLGYRFYFEEVGSFLSNISGQSSYFDEPRPYEPGFYYFMVISKAICSDFLFFKLLSGSVIVFCVLRAYILLTKEYGVAFFSFFALIFIDIVFHQFRNGLAMGFFILAVANYVNRAYFRFLLWSIISVSFHLSAIFVFAIPALSIFSFSFISVTGVIILSIVLREVEFFRLSVDLLLGGGSDSLLIETKVRGKLESPKYRGKQIEFGLGALKSTLIICALLLRDKMRSLTSREVFLAKIYVFGFAFFIVLSEYGIFASRVFRYFSLIEPLVLLSIVSIFKSRLILLFIFILYFILHVYISFNKFSSFPYSFSI